MKSLVMALLLLLCSTRVFAANDSAEIIGDLKTDGIHFSGDNSTISSSNDLLKNKGAWSAAANYSQGDVVQSNGSSYVCIGANINSQPPNASYWSVLAAQGVQGGSGSNGVTPTITSEAAGSNCTYGGVRIQLGSASPLYVCNGAASPDSSTATYVGTLSEYMTETNSSSLVTHTSVVNQSGSTISGTFSSSNGTAGTFTGAAVGNIVTFTNTFTQLPAGCTSASTSGMGSVLNNKVTQYYSGTITCAGTTYHFMGNGVLSKQ